MLMLVVMFGTYIFRLAAGCRHHTHGHAVCVSMRIAFIRLWDCAGVLGILHLSGDGARQARVEVGRRERGDGEGMRGRVRRRRRRRSGVLRWNGASASAAAAAAR